MDIDKFIIFKNNEFTQNFEINITAKYFKKQNNYDKLLAHIVKQMKDILEISRNKYNKDYVNIHIDFENFNIYSFDSKFAYTLTTVMQTLFPEKLNTCYIYNMNNFYKDILKMILNFLDERTKSKIQIVKQSIDNHNQVIQSLSNIENSI